MASKALVSAMHSDQVLIRQGADVVGPDGPLGRVTHVVVDEPSREISHFVLQRPRGSEWLIPATAVDHASDTIVTLLTGWSELSRIARPYAVDEFETVSGMDAVRTAIPTATSSLAESTRTPGPPPKSPSGGALQLHEDELKVRKQTHERGAVELRKEVVSEEQTIDIPVWHEELIIEHEVIDPPLACDEPVGEDRSIRVVLREEVAEADKQPVTTEVVRAGRRGVQETEHVVANVRREVADIQTEGNLRLHQQDNLGRQR